jgi:hypothetical protein
MDDELVPPELGCPVCGERRMDFLVWQDDEWLFCATCGIFFDSDCWTMGDDDEAK